MWGPSPFPLPLLPPAVKPAPPPPAPTSVSTLERSAKEPEGGSFFKVLFWGTRDPRLVSPYTPSLYHALPPLTILSPAVYTEPTLLLKFMIYLLTVFFFCLQIQKKGLLPQPSCWGRPWAKYSVALCLIWEMGHNGTDHIGVGSVR